MENTSTLLRILNESASIISEVKFIFISFLCALIGFQIYLISNYAFVGSKFYLESKRLFLNKYYKLFSKNPLTKFKRIIYSSSEFYYLLIPIFMKQLFKYLFFLQFLHPFSQILNKLIDFRSYFNSIEKSKKFTYCNFNGLAFAILFWFSGNSVFAAEVDLALSQSVSVGTPILGQSVTYTVSLTNQGNTNATNIVVEDHIPIDGIGSIVVTPSSGTWNFNSTTGRGTWTVASLPAGEVVTLEIQGSVIERGVFFNIAQIFSSDDTDIDSVPGNNLLYEDDSATSCFTVPILWYSGDEYTVEIPSPFTAGTGLVWFRDGNEITSSTLEATVNPDFSLVIKAPGSYTFTTTLSSCPATGCCAILIEQGPIFDLALRKTSVATNVVAGGQITYTLEIFNQGNVTATDIQISDYVPVGLILDDANWTLSGGIATLTNPISSLSAGASTTRTITFDVSPTASGQIANAAEISSAKGPSGEDIEDIDSTPDSDPSNDGTPINDEINQDGKNGGDEDDHDIGIITVSPAPVFDLALRKTLSTSGPLYPGSLVTFNIDVFNQGTIMATGVKITDYIPAGLELLDPNWVQVGAFAESLNPNLTILAGDVIPLTITFKISESFVGTSIRNSAEISVAKGPSGEDLEDIDSTPDNNSTNDGVAVENEINQNGKAGGDEDDADFSVITINQLASIGNFVWNDANQNGIQDNGELGIANITVTLERENGTFVATTTTDANGLYSFNNLMPGSYVVIFGRPSSYTSSVANQGNDLLDSDADPITGRSQVITLVAGENNTSVDAGFYIISCPDINSVNLTDSDICSGDSTLISAIASNGGTINWFLVPSGGSPLFTTNSGVNQLVFPTTSTVYYAQLSSIPAQCPTTRTPIALVVNQRPQNPTCLRVYEICTGETVNLSELILNSVTTPGGVFEWRVGTSPSSALVSNPTAVGAGNYYLFERSGAGCYSNPTEASIIEKSCDKFIDLALTKTATPTTLNINDVITYTIQVTNSGPDAATNVIVEDVLPSGLSFLASSTLTNNAGTLMATIPTIAVGQTVFLNFTARVTTGGTITNMAEVAAADQVDTNSTPGNAIVTDEDDNDTATINVIIPTPIADLSLRKLVNNSTPNVGDNITYTIIVQNAGPNIATNVEVEDVIPGGLTFISASGSDLLTTSSEKVTARFNTILVNQEVEFTIVARANIAGSIINKAEVTRSNQQDPDSTPGSGIDEDDDDISIINVQQPCNPTTPIISCANPFICAGASVSISAISCNGTVEWSNGMTGNVINVNPVTTTNYTAQCRVGTCLSQPSNVIQIVVNTISPPLVGVSSNTVCPGGSVTLTATGCAGVITWSNGLTGSSVQVTPTLPVTTYTAQCSILSCVSSASNSVSVTLSASPNAPVISATKTEICAGESITLSATGCAGTVSWSNGLTGSSITLSPVTNAVYSAICTIGSCTSSASNSINITIQSVQTPSISASNTTTCGAEPVTLTVSNCSTGVLWSNGSTQSSITVSPTATTTYSVNCGNGSCVGTSSITINVGGLGQTPTLSSSNSNICQGESVVLSATSCSGSISWENASSPSVVLGTGNTLNVTPSSTTTYRATCTTGTGCSGFANISINVTPTPTLPIVTCGAERICAGESLVFTAHNCEGTVTWSNGATGATMTVNPTVNTYYSAICTVNGCSTPSTEPILIEIITQVPVITASTSNVCSGGSATLTSSGCTGTLLWSNGATSASITVSPTVQTQYTLTCTVEGCVGTATQTITIGAGQLPTLTANNNTICAGESVTITGSNCATPLVWSTGTTGNSITVNPEVTTTYSATCGTGSCSGSASITINVGSSQTPTISLLQNTICAGSSATLTVSNCSGGILWSNGATSLSITVSPTTNTNYTVFCGSGACTRSATSEIMVSNGETPSLTASNNTICAGESVTVSAINCSSTINWSNGTAGASITVSPTATTTYTATCGTGTCSSSSSIVINVTPVQTPVIAATSTFICVGESTTLSVTNCSGNITWSNGATSAAITVSPTTNTTYTVTCGSGTCVGSRSHDIVVGNSQTPTVIASKNTICEGESVTITASNCSSGITWSNGASGNTITVSPMVTSTYTATCGSGSCSGSASTTISIGGSIQAPVISASSNSICEAANVILTASGCSGLVTWSNGQTGNSITVNITANQTFTAICTVGACISDNSNTLNISFGALSAPVISASGTSVCNGSSVVLTASGCSGNVLWSNGSTGTSITVNPSVATNYSAICRSLSANCDSPNSNVIRVEITTAPNAPTITCSADRICLGESLVLEAIGCEGTVTWYYNNTTANGLTLTINPVVTTVYTATCSIGSCESASSGAATITVGNPIPPVVTCNTPTICSGGSTTIEAAGCVGTVIWSNGMEGNVIVVSPTTLTTYSAICDAGICQSGQSNSISVVVTGSGIQKPTVNDLVNVCPNPTVDLSTAVTNQPVNGITYIYRTGNTPGSPAVNNPSNIGQTGTYYVFAAAGNGCFSEGTPINVVITNCVDPLPNCTTNPATANAGQSGEVCLNSDFIQLNGSIGGAATTSQWTSNGTGTFENSLNPVTKYFLTAQDITNGTVTFTLTTNDPDNGGACVAAVSSRTVTIRAVNVRPTISTSKSPVICLGDSVILTANPEGSYGYLWSNGLTTRAITVKTPGLFTVRFVDANGCTSLASQSVTVDISTAIASPTVVSPATNTCPATTVDLASKVSSSPITTGGIFEYRVANSPTSNMLATNNAVGEGTYYVFEKTLTGCYSTGSAINVIIDNCQIIQSDADIQVNILGNKTNVIKGDEVIYTLTIRNNGPANATNVNIQNVLPEGLELVGATPGLNLVNGNLNATIPAIPVGGLVTYTYTAKLNKAGLIKNTINKISANQNDPILSNNTDTYEIECLTCQETCISTALKADTLKQANGSYNIKFTALLKNCGNVNLTGVELLHNLSSMFPSPTAFTVIQKPTPNIGSGLVGNDSYNGSTDINLLNKTLSALPGDRVDTLVYVINLLPNGMEGPFSSNSIARGIGLTAFGIAQDVSDVSNDGSIIVKPNAEPTVVKLFKSPSIAIVLAIVDTVKLQNGSYNIKYQAIVKNMGSLDLSNVIVTDTLSKYFNDPASYTLVGNPSVNTGSAFVPNAAFDGLIDPRLILPSSTLAIGVSDTIWFTINLVPGDIKQFENQAIARGSGQLTNGTTETVVDISNSGYNPNEPGSSPTQLILGNQGEGSVINTCIGVALSTFNKTKLDDASYNITYQAIINNCGNLTLSNIALCDTLSNTFPTGVEVSIVSQPSISSGSTLVPVNNFDGVTNTCLLNSSLSNLTSGKIDTVRWTINLKLNSNFGPFRNNVTVTSTTPSGQIVSDVSNDGINASPEGNIPTVLNFNDNILDEMVGLAKNLESIKPVEGRAKVFDVEFKFVLKNYGIISFDKVQLQDNLAHTFGDKVIIDSVAIKDVSTGLTANENFTGKGDLTYLLNDTLSTLPVNASREISLLVRLDMSLADTLIYENFALAIGYFNDESVSDQSQTGLNPDKDFDGTPMNDSDPTIIDFTGLLDLTPITPLGIAKSIKDTVASADGSYLITYQVIVKNFGSVKLDTIQLKDDLGDVFSNNTQFALLGVPTLNDSSTLKINENFNGISDKNLLIDTLSSLLPNQADTLIFKVKVANNDLDPQTYKNVINGTAQADGKLVSDKSTNGENPDKNADGNPGNDSETTDIVIVPAKDDTTAFEVLISGGITPNGDSKNDILVIKDKNNTDPNNNNTFSESDNISVFVYNRWGHLVYRSENYVRDVEAGKGWDGSSTEGVKLENDKFVPDGTYYYIVSSTNTRLFGGKPVINFITIKR